MIAKYALVCGFLPALVLSAQRLPLERRQGYSCPAECSNCCPGTDSLECIRPDSGPGAGEWGCYDPNDFTWLIPSAAAASYSAPLQSMQSVYVSDYASSEPYTAYSGYTSSAPAYPSYSSFPEYSSSFDSGFGQSESSSAPLPSFGVGSSPTTTASGLSSASSSAGPPVVGSSGGDGRSTARWGLEAVLAMLGMAVLV